MNRLLLIAVYLAMLSFRSPNSLPTSAIPHSAAGCREFTAKNPTWLLVNTTKLPTDWKWHDTIPIMHLLHHRLQLQTAASFGCHDITAELQGLIDRAGIIDGLLVAVGQHTTTALALNENEERLLADIEIFFLELAAPDRPWFHNDLHLRPGIPADEPRNAHAHLIALMLGNQLSLPVVAGRLGLGRWQSVLFVELDGPRKREVLLTLLTSTENGFGDALQSCATHPEGR